MTHLRLTKPERDTHAWQKVRAAIDERLAMHRQKAENPKLPEAERLGAAWSIYELKALLKLEEPEAAEKPQPYTDAGY